MNFIGGDLTEIVCQHPTLGEFRVSPKSNESYTLDPGGVRNNDDANQTTSSGQMIQQKNRVRWGFEGPVAVDFINDTEIPALTALSASPDLGNWTFTLISGTIYKGLGIPVGDIAPDTNTAMVSIKIAGSGELEKI